jgi:hypothetical protein
LAEIPLLAINLEFLVAHGGIEAGVACAIKNSDDLGQAPAVCGAFSAAQKI